MSPSQNLSITSTPVPPIPLESLFPSTFNAIMDPNDSQQFSPFPPHPTEPYRIFIAPQSTRTPRSLFTTHKTDHREHYDRVRVLLPSQRQQKPSHQYQRQHQYQYQNQNQHRRNSPQGANAASPPKEEILLITTDDNNSGEEAIMEGSITTAYFWRDDRWITPDSGGHLGVTRRWALESGLCQTGIVKASQVVEGEIVLLSNGVIGFGWGRIEKLKDE